jgi:ferredoxin
VLACPEVFDLDDGGRVLLKEEAVASASLDRLKCAAYDCPTESITVTE